MKYYKTSMNIFIIMLVSWVIFGYITVNQKNTIRKFGTSMAEKDAVISDMRILIETSDKKIEILKATISAMMDQAVKDQKKILKYDTWLSRTISWGKEVTNKTDKTTDFCKNYVPWMIKAVKQFKILDEEIKTGME